MATNSKKASAQTNALAIKALKKANREIELERHGADHPWVAIDRPHRNRKKYNRKDQKKELRRTLSSFDFLKQQIRLIVGTTSLISVKLIINSKKLSDVRG